MNRALSSAMSGMRNHQIRMDVIGSNIANVNTTAFKANRATFREAMVQQLSGPAAGGGLRGGINPMQLGMGMAVSSIDTDFSQGFMESTGRITDLAIQGDGMFILRNGSGTGYTRAGNFSFDALGRLVTPDGSFVQGIMAVNGAVPATGVPQDITIPSGVTNAAQATTAASLTGNLDSRAAIGDTRDVPMTVYDSLGQSHVVSITFTKTAANSWSWSATDPSGGPAGTGTVSFNADGTLNTFSGSVSFTPTNGADPIAVSLSAAGSAGTAPLTQYASAPTAYSRIDDGYAAGTLESYTISPTGVISGTFSNGITMELARVVLANFVNEEGLTRAANSTYYESVASGPAQVINPGEGNSTMIASRSLEGSNVDLTQEFTSMITTQRGFQASARVITTSDEMLAEVANLKR